MRRALLYETVVVDGVAELDLLSGQLSSFAITRPVTYHRVKEHEVGRPDVISFANYGEERYWWVIATANNIYDPKKELINGKVLKIPNILDIYDYYKSARKR